MSDIIRKPAGAPGSTGGQFDGRTRTAAGGSLSLVDEYGTEAELLATYRAEKDLLIAERELAVRDFIAENPQPKLQDAKKFLQKMEAVTRLDDIAKKNGYAYFSGSEVGYDLQLLFAREDGTIASMSPAIASRDLWADNTEMHDLLEKSVPDDMEWVRKNSHKGKEFLLRNTKVQKWGSKNRAATDAMLKQSCERYEQELDSVYKEANAGNQ